MAQRIFLGGPFAAQAEPKITAVTIPIDVSMDSSEKATSIAPDGTLQERLQHASPRSVS